MTENKRFINIRDEIHLNGEVWCVAGGKHCADVIATALNELLDKNEQLKADNNRLVNETARIVAEHQKRVLDLIDKSLEKDKRYYEMSYESYLNGRIEALDELKKELIEQ